MKVAFGWQRGVGQAVAMAACVALAGLVIRPTEASAHTDQKVAGGELFATSGCTHCHGAEGEGGDAGPSLRNVRKRFSAAKIEHQIEFGGGAMPAFGSSLTHAQIEQLVMFLRAKPWATAPEATHPTP